MRAIRKITGDMIDKKARELCPEKNRNSVRWYHYRSKAMKIILLDVFKFVPGKIWKLKEKKVHNSKDKNAWIDWMLLGGIVKE